MLLSLLLATAAVEPAFDPLRFFAGRTRGTAELKVLFRARVPVAVRGSGTREGADALVLDQVIAEGSKPPRLRQWRLRRIAPGRYTGTLTDARGPVAGEAHGNRFHLRYTTKDGIRIEQWLTLAPDGRSAANRLEARRFGVRLATLTERIVRLD